MRKRLLRTLAGEAGRAALQLGCGTEPLQRAPAGIDFRFGTTAVFFVPVSAAARAESFAIFPAERAIRQGKQHLLAHNIFQQKAALFIIPDFRLRFADRAFPRFGIGAAGTEDQVKPQIGVVADRLKTAGTEQLKHAAAARSHTNVHHHFPGSAMLFNAVGCAFHAERARLAHVRGVVDRAGRDVQVELERVWNEIGWGNTHRTTIISASGHGRAIALLCVLPNFVDLALRNPESAIPCFALTRNIHKTRGFKFGP